MVKDQLEKLDDVSSGVNDRIAAWQKLNNPHPAGNYDGDVTTNGQGIGFIPAIEGVINAVADTNLDADNYTNHLQQLAQSFSGKLKDNFSNYAAGALLMVTKTRGGSSS